MAEDITVGGLTPTENRVLGELLLFALSFPEMQLYIRGLSELEKDALRSGVHKFADEECAKHES